MQLSITSKNMKQVQDALKKLSGQQAKEAYAKALNDAGFQLRRDMQRNIQQTFSQPTSFITRSPKVFAATPERLSVAVAPTRDTRKTHQPGMVYRADKGIDPQQVLQAQEFGGPRSDKRMERALQAAGLLPAGMQTSVPHSPYPGSVDKSGNFSGAFIRRVLAYFKAKGNASASRSRAFTRASIAKTRRTALLFEGRELFVPRGSLQPGIWARGLGGPGDLRPVIIFTRPGQYQPRLKTDKLADQAGLQDYLDKRVRYRIRQAAGI